MLHLAVSLPFPVAQLSSLRVTDVSRSWQALVLEISPVPQVLEQAVQLPQDAQAMVPVIKSFEAILGGH